ncbi:MAG TPA: hypothetical protein VEI48_10680 [Candidatus Sulfotelmatobacter sp.]|nr:hypothetical protein [Candidatus Sulfotelmatobacter sp.]
MPVVPVLAALVAITGAVVAVLATDSRRMTVATGTALLAAPFVADPLPQPLALGARLVGAALAAYLLWTATRQAAPLLGPLPLAGRGEAAFVVAAVAIGLLADSVTSEALGPMAALAAGGGLLIGGLDLLAFGHDGMRLGIGALLALTGASLVLVELGGTPGAGLEAGLAVATAAVAGAAAWLTVTTVGSRREMRLADRHGDLRDIG